jgi:Glycosyl hydrolase family 3 N terminal domain
VPSKTTWGRFIPLVSTSLLSVRHVPSPNFCLAESAVLTIILSVFYVDCYLVARGKGQCHHWCGLDIWPLCREYPSHRRLSRSLSGRFAPRCALCRFRHRFPCSHQCSIHVSIQRFLLYLFSQANGDNRRWKRSLLRARGVAMGEEHVGKGVNIALGPMMNLGRVAQGGRNWEGFGADPFLAGVGAYETILGMQSAGVQACAKHYINK